MRVVLATTSKQRAQVLERTVRDGALTILKQNSNLNFYYQPLKFEIRPSEFEENLDQNEYTFTEYVENTALGKVQNVYQKLKDDSRPPDLIIGLDTMVCFENKMFGKPKDKSEAISMIKK